MMIAFAALIIAAGAAIVVFRPKRRSALFCLERLASAGEGEVQAEQANFAKNELSIYSDRLGQAGLVEAKERMLARLALAGLAAAGGVTAFFAFGLDGGKAAVTFPLEGDHCQTLKFRLIRSPLIIAS